MLPFDGSTDLIQAQLIEDLLEEEIPGVKGALLIRRDGKGRGKGYGNG